MPPKHLKFAHFVDGEEVAYDYGNRFCRQEMRDGIRLVIGPTTGHVDLMIDLARDPRSVT